MTTSRAFSLSTAGNLALASVLATAAFAVTPDLHTLNYAGPAAPLESLDTDINSARTDRTKTDAIAADLLAELARGDNTVAARQAVCQRLGWVLRAPSGASAPASWAPLAQMLTEPANVEFARLALEPVPGAAVDALFVDALKKSAAATPSAQDQLHRDGGSAAPNVRVALLQSVERRRIAAAVPVIAPWVNDADEHTAAAAVRALGAIATRPAIQALQSATNAKSPQISIALLAAITRPASGGDQIETKDARQIAATLASAPAVPAAVRHAAWEYSLQQNSEPQRVDAIVTALRGNDWPLKEVAAASIATCRASQLTQRLAQELPQLDTPTQVAVLAALGRRGDAHATDVIVHALTNPSADVRLAAIDALGQLPGSRASAAALLQFIATDAAIEETKAARLSLSRMSGRDADKEIVAAAKASDPKRQSAAVEQLALRNVQDALPLLRDLRTAKEPAVRSAAATALGDIGPVSDQALLITWALQSTDDDERSHALRGLVTLTRRIHQADPAKPIWAALEKADPETAAKCMPVLTRLGDAGSAACASRLAIHGAPTVASAAVDALARWPDATAVDAQVSVATDASDPALRQRAFKAALTTTDRAADLWTPARTAAVARLAKASSSEADAVALLRLLRRANDAEAEKVAGELGQSAGTSAAARECVEVIQSNRSHRPVVKASGGWGLADMTDGKPSTAWTIAATAGQWVQVDFGQSRPVSRIILEPGTRAENTAGTLEFYVTDDVAAPGTALKTLVGQPRRMVVDVPAGTRGRFLMIKNAKERVDGYWSVAELIVE